MFRNVVLRGVSAGALSLAFFSSYSVAQEALPTIEVGAARAHAKSKSQRSAARSSSAPANSEPASESPPQSPATQNREASDYRLPEKATVGKSQLPLIDTPMSIQVVPSAVIKDEQAESMGDVVRNVSGVQSVYTLGGAYEHFVIRGFEQSFATYRNGVLAPFQRFQAANIDRVEILKGPSAALYGMSDPGGVINVITKQPSDKAAYYVEQRGGSFDHYRTEVGATGPLSPDGSLSYRVNASYLTTHGFRELTDVSDFFVAPAVSWQILPSTRINFNAEIGKMRTNYDQGLPAQGTGFVNVPLYRNFSQNGLYDDHRNNLFDLNVEHKFDENWKISAGLLSVNNYKDFHQFYAWANALQPGDTNADRFSWYGPERYFTQTAWGNLTGAFDTLWLKHHLLAGLEYSRMSGSASAVNAYIDTINLYTYFPGQIWQNPWIYNYLPPDFISRQNDKAKGVFVQDQIEVGANLKVLWALRYQVIRRENETAFDSPITYEQLTTRKLTPRFGLLYKLTPELSAFASYSESFGPAFLYQPSTLTKPEESRQYEIGLKSEMLDGRLQGSVALYDLTKRNVPVPSPDNPALLVAIGEARSHGVEFDLQGQILPGLDLITSYAFTGTRITQDTSGNEGNALPYAPRHQGSLWLKYSFQTEELRGLSIGGGVYAAGKRYGDAANSYYDGGYARIDLAGDYKFNIAGQTVIARLNVQNVNDARYFLMRSRWTNMPSAPRSVVGSLRVEF
jgi:iron complex outermembrane receptor protein